MNSPVYTIDRRELLLAGAAATMLGATRVAMAAETKLRVAVIGHTGRGNYGHGLDTVWLQVPETEIVAVADPSAEGLSKAKERLRVSDGFADYKQMLQTVKPDLVAVCPRHPDQHCDMILAAIEAGAKGIYVEKPYCRSLEEVDRIDAAAKEANAKVAIAHRNRYHPLLQTIETLIADGAVGRLLEIRGRGKGDRRGGAEDLWVLGSHVLNLMHYFGGDPLTCSAVMLQNGKEVVPGDVIDGAEALGPLAGNELHARYTMKGGVVGYFDSVANDGTRNYGFGLQLVGSEGVIGIYCDRNPLAYLRKGNPLEPLADPQPWLPIATTGLGKPERTEIAARVADHRAAAVDLIQAVQTDRAPMCDRRQAQVILEMIFSVFASHREDATVKIPLKSRANPLEGWKDSASG